MKKRVQVLVNLKPLSKMDRAELATQWQLLFKAPTPRGAQVDLLRRVLAWKLQSNNLERDSAEKFIRALRRWSRSSATVNLPVGAELVREWQGVVHKITVIEQGFEYDGKVYSALSPIAVKITGTVGWSGPRFFGLVKW